MIVPFVAVDPAAPTAFDQVDSPIGELLLTGSDDALTGLYMLGAPGGVLGVSRAHSPGPRPSCGRTSPGSCATSTCRWPRPARHSSWRYGPR